MVLRSQQTLASLSKFATDLELRHAEFEPARTEKLQQANIQSAGKIVVPATGEVEVKAESLKEAFTKVQEVIA